MNDAQIEFDISRNDSIVSSFFNATFLKKLSIHLET